MLLTALLLAGLSLSSGQRLLFTQLIWRHGIRTPIATYKNDPYNEEFFGVPDAELLPQGIEQHFVRGQQLRKIYVDEYGLVSPKYSRYETYVRSADFPRCVQSALANLAGFYPDSPPFQHTVLNFPSHWSPIPIHTVPYDDDFVLLAFDHLCSKYTTKQMERMGQPKFLDFLVTKWRAFRAINANSGDPADYSYLGLSGMLASLSVEKEMNLTLPDWVTADVLSELEDAFIKANDYTLGQAGFGLPFDKEMIKFNAGFFLNDWMNNIENVINKATKLKYYAYSGNDVLMNALLIGLGVKEALVGGGNVDYAATIICELWEKDGQYFVKFLYSHSIDHGFESFTRKIPGCGSDLCRLTTFKAFIHPLLANDTRICFD